jgi:hypothetical protein
MRKMTLKHRVRINVGRADREIPVIQSGQRKIREKLLTWLFGQEVGVFVLTPGKTVQTVEIHEVWAKAGDGNA